MATQSKLKTIAEERSVLKMEMLSRESVKWFMTKMANLKNTSRIPNTIKREEFRNTTRFIKGGLFFFYYDPKTKEDLPYYDRFPLVLMLEKYDDGFLGLNLHYLPIKYRVAFMNKLLDYGRFDEDGDPVRIRITYDILSATKRFKEFRPCIKRYLTSHVKSRILAVQPEEWETAVFLPVHQFKKAKADKVWRDSIQEIRKP
jgi:hypothetical protein